MALTPEDVVNKRFQPTKFREGYDQDEVDDFLDEVVVELRRLNHENEELRQRLIANESRISELQRSGSHNQGPAAPQEQFVAPVSAEPISAASSNAEPISAASSTAASSNAEPIVAPGLDYPAADVDANAMDSNSSTNNLLQLARRVHEEHVREGVEKRDALIAEGHAAAARLVAEAEATQRSQLSTLEQERTALESRIDELRTFEREYRQKLKGYIEGQLRELDSSNMLTTGDPAAPSPDSYTGFAGNA